jgi:hypothetical protein
LSVHRKAKEQAIFKKKAKKNFSFHAGAHLRKPTQGHTCVNCKTDFKRIFFFSKKVALAQPKRYP